MKDSVILGSGNSRYLKSVQDFKTLYPTYDDFAAALVAGTLPIDLNGINPGGFQQVGDAIGKSTLLKDSTASKFGLTSTPLGVSVNLAEANEGDIVQLPEGNVLVEFYVAKKNYEPDLNGQGRTLLVRKDCYKASAWNATSVNTYADSTLDVLLNGEYKELLGEAIRNAMGTTKFYYTIGNADATISTLERSVFELSLTEYGLTYAYANTEGSELPTASLLKIAYLNESAVQHWTRTPRKNHANVVFSVSTSGSYSSLSPGNTDYVRPAFTLPDDFTASWYVRGYDGEIIDGPFNALPDNAFELLSRFQKGLGNEYVWAKTTKEYIQTYEEETLKGAFPGGNGVSFADSFHIEDNYFVLDNPTFYSSFGTDTFKENLGKYAYIGSNRLLVYLYKLPQSATVTVSSGTVYVTNCVKYSNAKIEEKTTVHGYVNSASPTAYPPVLYDGYTYISIGQLGEKVQIESGSYVGDGSTAKTFQFSFAPKLLIIASVKSGYCAAVIMCSTGGICTTYAAGESGSYVYGVASSASGNSVTISQSYARYMCNESGNAYNYMAIA